VRDQTKTIDRLRRVVSVAGGSRRGTGSSAPARLSDVDLPGPWLILLGVLVFAAPNTHQIFARYDPALVERPFEPDGARRRLQWRASVGWATALALMFVASLLQLLKISPFLYFQF
jgi:hypothetical protein